MARKGRALQSESTKIDPQQAKKAQGFSSEAIRKVMCEDINRGLRSLKWNGGEWIQPQFNPEERPSTLEIAEKDSQKTFFGRGPRKALQIGILSK